MKEKVPKTDVTNVPSENQQIFIEQNKIADGLQKDIVKANIKYSRGEKIAKMGDAASDKSIEYGPVALLGSVATGVGVGPALAGVLVGTVGGQIAYSYGEGVKENARLEGQGPKKEQAAVFNESRKLVSQNPDIELARAEMRKELAKKGRPDGVNDSSENEGNL